MSKLQDNLRRGFSLVELLIVISIILILAAIAGPNLLKGRSAAQEAAAISAIKTLHVAQTQYYAQFSKYATALAELGPPTTGAAGPQAADLVPGALAAGNKGGYLFTLQGTQAGYQINANPETFGTSGNRSFFSDQSQVIREHYGQESATAQSKALP